MIVLRFFGNDELSYEIAIGPFGNQWFVSTAYDVYSIFFLQNTPAVAAVPSVRWRHCIQRTVNFRRVLKILQAANRRAAFNSRFHTCDDNRWIAAMGHILPRYLHTRRQFFENTIET